MDRGVQMMWLNFDLALYMLDHKVMSDRSIIGWFSARSETDQLVRRVLDFVIDILGMRSSYSQVEVNRSVAWMYYWQLATVTADQKRTEDKYLENEGNLTSTVFWSDSCV